MLRRALACWGNGAHGRLGLPAGASVPTVCEALLSESLSAVFCGGAHTCVLTGEPRARQPTWWERMQPLLAGMYAGGP